jgi:dolichol-phosphate mannosyltransferase
LAKRDGRVKGIQFSRNFGQHYGITAGLDHCLGDWVVVMDCDLQDRPEEIPRLYAKAQEGYDIVLARRGQRQDPLLKRFNSWFFYKVFQLSRRHRIQRRDRQLSYHVAQGGRQLSKMREQLRFFGGLVQWLGFPTASIVVPAERTEGRSSYTFAKLWKLAAEAIITYSDKPLRLAVPSAFLWPSSHSAHGVYVFIRATFYGAPVLGWSSLIVSLYFIGGIIIGILGILGIYLGKTFR